jgi:Protein of unknown function (DUF1488)
MNMLKRASEERIFDFDKKAVGFWMVVEDIGPVRPVRIFVTHEALSGIDPREVCDVDGSLSIFDKNRDRIEQAANTKFDDGKIEDWPHEGQPVIVLRDSDF